jgi:pimeloyl-ACP methyl ester carboxylesterase
VSIFALVHGAWHGPWCWDRLRPLLEERGYGVIVPDLPSADIELGLQDYADAIERALGAADDVILVPHSLGGLVGPVVARRRPLKALVYLCGLVPQPGLSFGEQVAAAEEPILTIGGGREMDEQGRSHWPNPDATARIMYPDLTAEDATWAFSRLRPQAQKSQGERSPEPPTGLRVESIVGTEDRLVSPDWSRRVARERLGVEPVEIPTGHFPMITHPELLAGELAKLDAE